MNNVQKMSSNLVAIYRYMTGNIGLSEPRPQEIRQKITPWRHIIVYTQICMTRGQPLLENSNRRRKMVIFILLFLFRVIIVPTLDLASGLVIYGCASLEDMGLADRFSEKIK